MTDATETLPTPNLPLLRKVNEWVQTQAALDEPERERY